MPTPRQQLNLIVAITISFLTLCAILAPPHANAAGSYTTIIQAEGSIPPFKADTLQSCTTLTADAADGSFPQVPFSNIGGKLLGAYVYYGAANVPTTAFDLAIYTTVSGTATVVDLLGGVGADLVTSASTYDTLVPQETIYNEKWLAPFAGPLYAAFTGNVVNSAVVNLCLLTTP